MASEEDEKIAREILGTSMSEVEINRFFKTTVAGNPVGVNLSLWRYCRHSSAVPLVFKFIVALLLLTWALSFWTWWAAFIPALLALILSLLLLRLLQTSRAQYLENLSSLIANGTIPTDPNAPAILVKDILARPSGPPPLPT